MRVSIVLAVGVLAVAVGLAVDMSGRAVRLAGTNHVSPVAFGAAVRSNGALCQPGTVLPADAHSVELLIGTYGHPVPSLTASFSGAGSEQIATGRLPAGAREGYVEIPLRNPRGRPAAGSLCIKVGKAVQPVVFGGENFTPGAASEQIDGQPAAARIDLLYRRGRAESWWQLLPVLAERFGLGKSSVFGTWTLPAMALLLGCVWIGALRLMARELA